MYTHLLEYTIQFSSVETSMVATCLAVYMFFTQFIDGQGENHRGVRGNLAPLNKL